MPEKSHVGAAKLSTQTWWLFGATTQGSSATHSMQGVLDSSPPAQCLSGMPRHEYSGVTCVWAHLLDVGCVSQHHGQAVNAQAPASSGRQAILQTSTEALVNEHGFIITLRLGLHMTTHCKCFAMAVSCYGSVLLWQRSAMALFCYGSVHTRKRYLKLGCGRQTCLVLKLLAKMHGVVIPRL